MFGIYGVGAKCSWLYIQHIQHSTIELPVSTVQSGIILNGFGPLMYNDLKYQNRGAACIEMIRRRYDEYEVCIRSHDIH